jgi:hypothetical protein
MVPSLTRDLRTLSASRRHAAAAVAMLAVLALPCLAIAQATTTDAEDLPAPAAAQPTSATAQPASASRRLPFLAEEARARGFDLPLPFGASLIVTRLGGRKIDVTDVRIGVEGNPAQSVSQFLDLGSTSDVFNANLKFDAWLLPFLNVYALIGYVHNDSTTHARITLPAPGPLPGNIEVEKDIETQLDGFIGGLGFTLAGGYKNFYMVFDCNYDQTDLGFDNDFTATIASVRTGWNGRLGELPVQLWLGVGNWDTAATATGHVDLDDGRRLKFEADQRPSTNWMYDVGGNFEFSKRFQLVVDVGFDFQGGYVVVLGPTYRY